MTEASSSLLIESAGDIANIVHCDPSRVLQVAWDTNDLMDLCHGLAANSGWWSEYESMPEQYRKHFIAGKLALVHSEVSEGLEGFRKGLPDDHLPHRRMFEVELADAIIRICDIAGKLGLDLGGAVVEKLAYNQRRADHKPENREAVGGKSM